MQRIECTYGYIRKSPTGEDEIPIEFQERKIRKWAELNNSRFMKTFIETIEADVPLFERPLFSQLWRELDRGDVLVITDLYGVTNVTLQGSILLNKLTDMHAFLVSLRDGYNTFTQSGSLMVYSLFMAKVSEKHQHAEYLKDDDQP